MKTLLIILIAALALPAAAAIKIDGPQVRNMDDVNSLGVIYINRNSASDAPSQQQASGQIVPSRIAQEL